MAAKKKPVKHEPLLTTVARKLGRAAGRHAHESYTRSVGKPFDAPGKCCNEDAQSRQDQHVEEALTGSYAAPQKRTSPCGSRAEDEAQGHLNRKTLHPGPM
jgi:hypothetical protein